MTAAHPGKATMNLDPAIFTPGQRVIAQLHDPDTGRLLDERLWIYNGRHIGNLSACVFRIASPADTHAATGYAGAVIEHIGGAWRDENGHIVTFRAGRFRFAYEVLPDATETEIEAIMASFGWSPHRLLDEDEAEAISARLSASNPHHPALERPSS